MQLILVLIMWFVIGLAPVTLSGPVPALLFVSAAKKKKLSRFYPVWFVILNILLFIYTVGMHGGAGPGPGDFAMCATPLAILLTFYILNRSDKVILQAIDGDLEQQRYYHLGKALLPAMQIGVLAVSFIFLWVIVDSGLLAIWLHNLE